MWKGVGSDRSGLKVRPSIYGVVHAWFFQKDLPAIHGFDETPGFSNTPAHGKNDLARAFMMNLPIVNQVIMPTKIQKFDYNPLLDCLLSSINTKNQNKVAQRATIVPKLARRPVHA